jgi:hypothetical protein
MRVDPIVVMEDGGVPNTDPTCSECGRPLPCADAEAPKEKNSQSQIEFLTNVRLSDSCSVDCCFCALMCFCVFLILFIIIQVSFKMSRKR